MSKQKISSWWCACHERFSTTCNSTVSVSVWRGWSKYHSEGEVQFIFINYITYNVIWNLINILCESLRTLSISKCTNGFKSHLVCTASLCLTIQGSCSLLETVHSCTLAAHAHNARFTLLRLQCIWCVFFCAHHVNGSGPDFPITIDLST